MDDDLALPSRLRVMRRGSPPLFLRTLGNALDLVQSLPDETRFTLRWRATEELLFKADDSHVPTDLRNAYDTLLKTMRDEDWDIAEEPPQSADWPLDRVYSCVTFNDWEAFLATMTPYGVAQFIDDVIQDRLCIQGMLNCFLAGIKRMRDMAHLGTAPTEEERARLLKLSDCLLKVVEVRFAHKPEELERMRDALEHSKRLYEAFGNEHARQWLYDAGFYDAYGVQLKPPLDR